MSAEMAAPYTPRSFEPVYEDASPPSPKPANKAIIVSQFGHDLLLEFMVDPHVEEFMRDSGMPDGPCSLEEFGCDSPRLDDGVWVLKVRLADDGPGDWPGTREAITEFYDPRPCTEQEWRAHLAGEWPWVE